MKRALSVSISILVAVIVGLTTSLAMDAVFLDSPHITAHVFSPSTARRCQRFKEGMLQPEVLSGIDDAFPPVSEALRQGYVSFVGIDGDSCVVEFDHQTSKVISVRFERRSRTSAWGGAQKEELPPEQ